MTDGQTDRNNKTTDGQTDINNKTTDGQTDGNNETTDCPCCSSPVLEQISSDTKVEIVTSFLSRCVTSPDFRKLVKGSLATLIQTRDPQIKGYLALLQNKTDLIEAQKELVIEKEKSRQMSASLDSKDKEIANLKTNVEALQSELKKSQSLINGLIMQHHGMKAKEEKNKQVLFEAKSEAGEASAAKKLALSKLQECQVERDNLLTKVASIEKQMEEASEGHQRILKSRQSTTQVYIDEVNRLKKEIAERKASSLVSASASKRKRKKERPKKAKKLRTESETIS
jgi:hypothetical protein